MSGSSIMGFMFNLARTSWKLCILGCELGTCFIISLMVSREQLTGFSLAFTKKSRVNLPSPPNFVLDLCKPPNCAIIYIYPLDFYYYLVPMMYVFYFFGNAKSVPAVNAKQPFQKL